jgi:adenosylcobinamide-phosphate synthase
MLLVRDWHRAAHSATGAEAANRRRVEGADRAEGGRSPDGYLHTAAKLVTPAMKVDLVLLLAIALDDWLGEPPTPLHPVVWMGRSIAALERRAPWGAARSERRFGLLMALGLPVLWALGLVILTRASTRRNRLLCLLLRAWLLKTTFAVRSLGETVRPVAQALVVGDLAASRSAVAMLVSRSVATLS